MTESFFTSGGLYYRTNRFEAGKRTLVFVHGLSGSSSAWKEYEERFESRYNILTFDLRGHGASVKPASYGDYEIGKFVGDLKNLTDFLHIDKFVLISHSFGAAAALEFLLAFPEKVGAAVFLAPDFNTRKILFVRILFPFVGWCTGILGLFPFLKRVGGHLDYARYKNTGDWNVRRIFADVSNTGLHAYFYCLKQLYGFNRENRLEEIHVPTLIIHGTKDSMVPYQHSVEATKKIAGAKLIILQNANHILILNNFPEVAQAIGDFIA